MLLPHSIVSFPEPRALFLQIGQWGQGAHGAFEVGADKGGEVGMILHQSISRMVSMGYPLLFNASRAAS